MSKNKKCVYFTRHGQTFWNVEDKICGSTDIALTEYGQEQAIALGPPDIFLRSQEFRKSKNRV